MFDPVVLVISREEVELRNLAPALGMLRRLIDSPEDAEVYFERLEVSFHGYDDDSRSLWEIVEVRNYVGMLDDAFPYWLYFLSKKTMGLHTLAQCLIPPHLVAAEHASRTGHLLLKRWFPALNYVCEYVGMPDDELREMSERVHDYFTTGPLN